MGWRGGKRQTKAITKAYNLVGSLSAASEDDPQLGGYSYVRMEIKKGGEKAVRGQSSTTFSLRGWRAPSWFPALASRIHG